MPKHSVVQSGQQCTSRGAHDSITLPYVCVVNTHGKVSFLQGFRSSKTDMSNDGTASLSPFSSSSDGCDAVESAIATNKGVWSEDAHTRSASGLQGSLPPTCEIVRFMSAILQGLHVLHLLPPLYEVRRADPQI